MILSLCKTEFHAKYEVSILLNTDVTMVTWRDLVPQTVDFQNISPICPHIRVKICKTVPMANKMTKNKVYSFRCYAFMLSIPQAGQTQ